MNTNTLRTTLEWPAGKAMTDRFAAAICCHALNPLHLARRHGFRILLAAVPALAIVVATAWAVSAFETPRELQALVWSAGFVFLALAVESRKPNVTGLLATGLALPALALLSARVAPEFTILAAVLVAAWIGAAIFRLTSAKWQASAESR